MAKNFREIFGELAPGGRGELVMQKQLRPDPQQDVDPEEDEEAGPSDRAGPMERYAGVKVKVGCCMVHTIHAHVMHICFLFFPSQVCQLQPGSCTGFLQLRVSETKLGWVGCAILILSCTLSSKQ